MYLAVGAERSLSTKMTQIADRASEYVNRRLYSENSQRNVNQIGKYILEEIANQDTDAALAARAQSILHGHGGSLPNNEQVCVISDWQRRVYY